MKNFVIINLFYCLLGSVLMYFVIEQKTQITVIPVPKQVLKADITMIDNGVPILDFDNATILPVQGNEDIRFMCMDTEYALTGTIETKFLK